MDYYERIMALIELIRKKLAKILDYNLPFTKDEFTISEEKSSNMSQYPHNERKYPFNIYEPDEVIINDKKYVRYKAKFNGLYDLYTY